MLAVSFRNIVLVYLGQIDLSWKNGNYVILAETYRCLRFVVLMLQQ